MRQTYSFKDVMEAMDDGVDEVFISSDLDLIWQMTEIDGDEQERLAGLTFTMNDRSAVGRYKAEVLQMMHKASEDMRRLLDGRGHVAASGRHDHRSLLAAVDPESPEYDPDAARLMEIDRDMRGYLTRQLEKGRI